MAAASQQSRNHDASSQTNKEQHVLSSFSAHVGAEKLHTQTQDVLSIFFRFLDPGLHTCGGQYSSTALVPTAPDHRAELLVRFHLLTQPEREQSRVYSTISSVCLQRSYTNIGSGSAPRQVQVADV